MGSQDQTLQRQSNKWAYLQVVGLAFLMIGGIQTILANSGNFIAVVCPDMGFEISKFTLWITCYAIGMAVSQLYVGKLWLVVKTPILLTASFLVCIASLAAMSSYTEIWQWYVSGVVIGLSRRLFLHGFCAHHHHQLVREELPASLWAWSPSSLPWAPPSSAPCMQPSSWPWAGAPVICWSR